MPPNPPFEKLYRLLLSRGLSPPYARRYVQELIDHRDDLLDELKQQNLASSEVESLADERLGAPVLLAEAALAAFRSRTFMGRHPRLFFAFLPFLLFPIFFTLLIMLIVVPFSWVGVFRDGVPPSFQSSLLIVFECFKYTAPAAIGMLYYRATRRRALPRAFRITTSAAAILWACFFKYYLSFHRPGPHGQLMVGVGTYPHPTQALAVAAAIFLYAWFIQRRSFKSILTA